MVASRIFLVSANVDECIEFLEVVSLLVKAILTRRKGFLCLLTDLLFSFLELLYSTCSSCNNLLKRRKSLNFPPIRRFLFSVQSWKLELFISRVHEITTSVNVSCWNTYGCADGVTVIGVETEINKLDSNSGLVYCFYFR